MIIIKSNVWRKETGKVSISKGKVFVLRLSENIHKPRGISLIPYSLPIWTDCTRILYMLFNLRCASNRLKLVHNAQTIRAQVLFLRAQWCHSARILTVHH
ncbi:hypothetical protein XENOCAPTIV_015799 [Xenoophorus captivus]|uniref:Uncharacterized protein n=1 Tax=Xenoophorus captivus TaxID=1517983 RepID=A0ABV0S1R9_9TELE